MQRLYARAGAGAGGGAGGAARADAAPDTSTVTRWIYGGHDSPRDLTSTEETLLVSAGYSFDVRNI